MPDQIIVSNETARMLTEFREHASKINEIDAEISAAVVEVTRLRVVLRNTPRRPSPTRDKLIEAFDRESRRYENALEKRRPLLAEADDMIDDLFARHDVPEDFDIYEDAFIREFDDPNQTSFDF